MQAERTPLELYLQDARRQFRALKKLADRALAQVADADWFVTLGAESNSLAVIVKHVAGNLRSRWTDIFTTDGEKPDRYRDTEFELTENDTKDALQAYWDRCWDFLFATLDSLTADDLGRTILIRDEPHAVIEAINRQILHYSMHVGQIVFLSKHLAHDHWQSLSIPRGQSAVFNASKQPKRGEVWESAKQETSA
ncbi:MAG TPA: DUF1572 family protein [Blastocatellia bacterium]|nr:DUF1572 family protein [Blastocatellia bacterium]